MHVDQVRKRAGMYIGDTTDGSGLHRMVFEVVDNAINEALAGCCDQIGVVLNADGSVTVRDNGRGIPTDQHPIYDKSVPEIIMTQLHAGGKFAQTARHINGVGLAVVNALSDALCLRIWRDGVESVMRFHRGNPEASLAIVGAAEIQDGKPRRGTEITFTPDATIFTNTKFDFMAIDCHLRELAVFNSGATVLLADKRDGETKEAVYRA